MHQFSPKTLITILALLLPLSMILGISFGSVSIALNEVFQTLFSNNDSNATNKLIIQQIRLPRVILAAIIGALLAYSGVAMQGLFRNPLADPSLVGVTSGASLGASVMIVFGGFIIAQLPLNGHLSVNSLSISLIAIGAFIGGVISTFIVYRFSTNKFGTSVMTMLLIGIAISAIASSINSLFKVVSSDEMLRQISLWQMGGLNRANYSYVIIALCTLIFASILFPKYHQALDALLLGESEARHLGFDVNKVTKQLILLIALCVGVSVALSGIIGFVGLIIPHMVRLLIGPKHKALLVSSALAGAILLVLADIISRTLMSPAEIPIGVVTAIIGAPFFILLLRRMYISI